MKILKTSDYLLDIVCRDIEMSTLTNNYNIFCGTLSAPNKYHRYKHKIYYNL